MSKYCPFCGEELVDSAKFCRSCGKNIENLSENNHNANENQNISQNQTTQFEVPSVEKEHTALIVIGYICGLLFPLVGVIIAIYLLTRKDSSKGNKHGKYILIVSIVIWALSLISIFR